MIFKTLFIELHNAFIYSDGFAIVFKRYTCMFECKYIIIACEWMCGRCICVLRGKHRDTTLGRRPSWPQGKFSLTGIDNE